VGVQWKSQAQHFVLSQVVNLQHFVLSQVVNEQVGVQWKSQTYQYTNDPPQAVCQPHNISP